MTACSLTTTLTSSAREYRKIQPGYGGKQYQAHQKAIIIGAGRTGTALAPMLEADGISVKVIDLDPEQCRHISSKLKSPSSFAATGRI